MEVSYLTLSCLISSSEMSALHFVIKVKFNTFRNIFHHKYHSATPSTYPAYFILAFFLLYLGVLRLANPYQSSFSFTWRAYLSLHLLHPRAQIKLLISLYLLYLSIYLPSLNSLVRFYSLFYNMKLENE